MKEMMFEFLDNFYPHIRLLKTKFGIIPMYGMKANYAIGEVKRKHVKIVDLYMFVLKTPPILIPLSLNQNRITV
jgi:hypothetical protein